eukprot:5465529-Pleurochrysis_carterae.AAC.1
MTRDEGEKGRKGGGGESFFFLLIFLLLAYGPAPAMVMPSTKALDALIAPRGTAFASPATVFTFLPTRLATFIVRAPRCSSADNVLFCE